MSIMDAQHHQLTRLDADLQSLLLFSAHSLLLHLHFINTITAINLRNYTAKLFITSSTGKDIIVVLCSSAVVQPILFVYTQLNQ